MDLKSIKKKYSNGDVTIIWNPGLCVHSTNCWKKHGGLPEVFDPSKRPWITPEGVDSELIKKHVAACPSGALSIEGAEQVAEVKLSDLLPKNIQKKDLPEENKPAGKVLEAPKTDTAVGIDIEILENGPILVKNACEITMNGEKHPFKPGACLCRCGNSKTKPFCDGSHVAYHFIG